MPTTITVRESGDLSQQLRQIEASLVRSVMTKAARAAANVVKRRLKQKIKRSIDTGTRDLWSEATEKERSGVKPHAETVGVVVRDYGLRIVAVVGAQYPAGALSHLIEKDHKLVAWGRATGLTITGTPYTEQAADETINEQLQAIESTVRNEVAKEIARVAVSPP